MWTHCRRIDALEKRQVPARIRQRCAVRSSSVVSCLLATIRTCVSQFVVLRTVLYCVRVAQGGPGPYTCNYGSVSLSVDSTSLTDEPERTARDRQQAKSGQLGSERTAAASGRNKELRSDTGTHRCLHKTGVGTLSKGQNRPHMGGKPRGHPAAHARRRHDAERSQGAAGLSERWAAAGRGAPGDCHLLPPSPAAAQAAVAACGCGRCRLERCGRRAAAEASRAEPLHVRHPARVRQRRAASQTGAAGPHKTTPGLNSPTWVVAWAAGSGPLYTSRLSRRPLPEISPTSRLPLRPATRARLALHHSQPGAWPCTTASPAPLANQPG